MSEFHDGMSLPFRFFADSMNSEWMESVPYVSYFKTKIIYTINLTGKLAKELPEKVRSQYFDEDYLQPMSTELGISMRKAAKLMALRNAWVTNFQDNELPKVSFNQLGLQLTNEIAVDYVFLTSSKWTQHPWMQEQISLPDSDDLLCVKPYSPEELACHYEHWKAQYENGLRDIKFCINLFDTQKGLFSSCLEAEADAAKHDIKRANKKIEELHAEVKVQEGIIKAANKPIREFKDSEKLLNKRSPGRQKATDEKIERGKIAKRFVSQWIKSLMTVLSITSFGELAKIGGGVKMTWWRWKNEEALPTLSFLNALSNIEIKIGKNEKIKFRDIQTNPSLTDLITLVELI